MFWKVILFNIVGPAPVVVLVLFQPRRFSSWNRRSASLSLSRLPYVARPSAWVRPLHWCTCLVLSQAGRWSYAASELHLCSSKFAKYWMDRSLTRTRYKLTLGASSCTLHGHAWHTHLNFLFKVFSRLLVQADQTKLFLGSACSF